MKKLFAIMMAVALTATLLAGCGASAASSAAPAAPAASEAAPAEATPAPAEPTPAPAPAEPALADGIYEAEFITDSTMFGVNETCDGKGTLYVQDGAMTIHITLKTKNIANLYLGLAEDAKKDGAEILEPTVDTVTYPDGLSEEVFGFDVPVAVVGEDFDLALIGKKGVWYDHKVSVQNPEPLQNDLELEDGVYTVEVTLEGGSGRASVQSPADLYVQDGEMTARIVWSSDKYDFMMVDGEKLLPEITEGHSIFTVPVSGFDVPMAVQADTVAMSTPHLIDYTLCFASDSVTYSGPIVHNS